MAKSLVPIERIQNSILFVRGQKVMIDRDIAALYGVETRRLNEQVKRNKGRFPEDFMFQLTKKEKDWIVANCDHLQILKFSRTNPYAFTEHGAVMLASILNTEIAVQASIQVVRAFVKLRKLLISNEQLSRKLIQLEKKYDNQFNIVFKALKQLIDQPEPKKREIGFKKPGELN